MKPLGTWRLKQVTSGHIRLPAGFPAQVRARRKEQQPLLCLLPACGGSVLLGALETPGRSSSHFTSAAGVSEANGEKHLPCALGGLFEFHSCVLRKQR